LVYVSKSVGEEIYSFIDPSVLSELVYYKIKIINKDNSISYSNVVIVKPAAASSNQLSILRNPVKSTLYFSYTSLASGHYNVAIYTVGGTKMSNRKMYMQKGTNSLSVDLNNALPAGGYILEVTNGSERQVAKLLKQ
jgi:methionine-rich copper-binding protein CopC